MEGYESDLTAMCKKITFYQKYIAKLKNLVDEDQGGDMMDVLSEEEIEGEGDQEEDHGHS